MGDTKNESDPQTLSFEQALERLESIVHELEDGQAGLNDALARYEEGVGLLKYCHAALSQVERKISLLTGIDSEGTAITEPFDEETMSLEEKQESRGRRRSQSRQPAGSPQPPTRPAESHSPEAPESDMDRQRGLF